MNKLSRLLFLCTLPLLCMSGCFYEVVDEEMKVVPASYDPKETPQCDFSTHSNEIPAFCDVNREPDREACAKISKEALYQAARRGIGKCTMIPCKITNLFWYEVMIDGKTYPFMEPGPTVGGFEGKAFSITAQRLRDAIRNGLCF